MPFVFKIVSAGSSGQNKTNTYHLTAADFATAQTDATAILTAFQAVSDAVVQKTLLTWEVEYPGTLPTSGVDTAIVATISGRVVSTQKPVTVKFPAPKAAIRADTTGEGYNELDLTNTLVTDYWSLFATGAEATISDGEHVAATPRSSQIISLASRQP